MTRLLVVADAGKPTGFERVARSICETLFERGYTIVQRGLQYDEGTTTRKYPWTVKSWGGTPEDPYGTGNLRDWIAEDRPDAMLVIEDPWNITNYMTYKPRELPVVAYTPVDCPNVKWNHAMGLAACAEAVSYTRFGAMELAAGIRETLDIFWQGHKDLPEANDERLGYLQYPNLEKEMLELRVDRLNRYQNPSNWNVIPHGATKGVFEPRDRAKARELFGFPQDAFIVLNVNANQFRKRLDLTVRAFAGLYRQRKDALLVLHCGRGDIAGWDLLQLARYYGVEGRIACVHYQMPVLSDDQLCWLYNTADVQINTAGGEGWGLTSFEGAACGIPQLTPDWSTGPELWEGYGWLLPVSDWRNEPKQLNTTHGTVSAQAAADVLLEFAEDAALRERFREQSLAQAARQVPWENVGGAFDTLIQRALSESVEPDLMALPTVLKNREPGVKSAIAGVLWPGDSNP